MVGNICPLHCSQEQPPSLPKNSCRGHFLFANDAKCVQVNHVKFSSLLNGQLWQKATLLSPLLQCLPFCMPPASKCTF